METHAGGLLRVDLGAGRVSSEALPEVWRRRYVGGKGLAARLLYDEVGPDVAPLSPRNVLVFAVGPLTGLLPGEPRYAAVTKSPQTGGFLDSYAGGTFPGRLAGALGDHELLVVTGAADRPSRVVVSDGAARVEPADDWWGLDAASVADRLDEGAAACIGPAGEHRVAFSTIASDGGDHHAGRGGAGAVMGAKRLKAVVARGEPPTVPPSIEPLREAAENRYEDSATGRWQQTGGTAESVDFADAIGALATRGWRANRFEGTDAIGVDAVRDRAVGRERDEDGFPGDFRVASAAGTGVVRGAAGMTLGAGLGIADADAVATLSTTCDRLGLDLVSAGNVLAWAVRADEAGHLDAPLGFGDPAAAQSLLTDIAFRATPLADGLADGLDGATQRYGGAGLVPAVRGLELPNYDPRAAPSMALAYATSDRGGCHRRARPVEREPFDGRWSADAAARAVIAEQNERAARWCLIADDFVGESIVDAGADWLSAIGHPAGSSDLTALGERVWTLTRLFNVREGWNRGGDSLPSALADPPADDAGGAAVDPDKFEAMLDAYYAHRDWTRDGRPTRQLVERLGLRGLAIDEGPLAERTATASEDR